MGWIKNRLRSAVESQEGLLGSLAALLLAALVASALAVSLSLISSLNLSGNLDPNRMGVVGDFLGGSLNPFLTFITFLALIFTIVLQQQELALARTEFHRTADALENENFESTFFRLTERLHDIALAVEFGSPENRWRGVAAFNALHNEMKRLHRNTGNSQHQANDSDQRFKDVTNAWGHQVSHYLRVLSRILAFLESKIQESDSQEVRDIGIYIDLLRAQLSNPELALILYHCRNEWGADLKPYVEKFSLLQHLPKSYVLEERDRDGIDPRAWGASL